MANTVIVNVEANTASATANITSTTVAVDNLTKAEQKLNQESKKVASGFEDVTKNGGAIAILDQLTGGLASRVRDTFEATKLFNFSLKGMRTALIATGIGAFIVALGLVVAYWDEIVEFITGANAALQKQIDLKNEYIEGIDYELTVLKAQQDLAKAQGGFNKELAAQQRAKLKDLLTERKLQVELLELQLQNLRHGDYEEYLETHKAFEKAKLDVIKTEIALQNSWNEVTEKAKTNREKQAADEKLLSEQRKKANEDSLTAEREKASEIEQITAGQVNTEAEKRAEEIRQNQLKYDGLLALARKYYEDDSIQIKELETTQQEIETEIKLKHAEEDRATQKVIDDLILADKQVADQKIIDDEQTVADAKASIRSAELNNVAAGISTLTSLAPKSKALQAAGIIASNAVGVAKIVQSTVGANAAARLKYGAIPAPTGTALIAAEIAANNVSAKIGIATSIIATAKGLAALKSGGSPSVSTTIPGDTGGGAQAPAFNIVGQGQGSQIASALGEQQSIPVQAFVVSQDVTTAQSLQNNIIQGAILGD
jgi:hypothetical protein